MAHVSSTVSDLYTFAEGIPCTRVRIDPPAFQDGDEVRIMDGNMKELRKGTNGWMCMLDLGRQGREQHRSLCHQGDGRQPLGRERAAHHDPARRRRAAGALPNRLDQGGPWAMWKGTPYAHVMVPLTGAPKASGKKPAEKK